MDAIDAVLVRIDPARLQVVRIHSLEYPPSLRRRLDRLVQNDGTPDEVGRLDRLIGEAFAQCALEAVEQAGLAAHEVQAIGSHGQTVRHAPEGPEGFTLQLGDPNIIAERTGITTVGDFRRRDIAAGGQGAPLAPAFHAWFFGAPDQARALLNLGGIANLTLIPCTSGTGETSEAALEGFDTGPANALLDTWHQMHRGAPFDRNGLWARSGTIQPALLQDMLADPYFQRVPPKSTGREYFSSDWLETHLQRIPNLQPVDVQRTLLELTARSVTRAFNALPQADLYLCGGGARNAFLVERLRALMPERNVKTTGDIGLEPEAVEGAAFAWLAKQTLEGKPGNLPASTGAAGPRVLGAVYPA